jgi:hypothetical protein
VGPLQLSTGHALWVSAQVHHGSQHSRVVLHWRTNAIWKLTTMHFAARALSVQQTVFSDLEAQRR